MLAVDRKARSTALARGSLEGSRRLRNAVNWRQAAGEALLIFFRVGVALLGQAAWEARVERDVIPAARRRPPRRASREP